MNNDFYLKARRWYNTVYVNPASERFVYFIIFIISLLCLIQSFLIIDEIYVNNKRRNTYIMLMEHKVSDDYLKVSKIQTSSKKSHLISFLELVLKKYVTNMESLVYDENKKGIDVINDKSLIIKNLSGQNVYDNYISSSCCEEGSDISLTILKIQKTITINKIEFLYEDISFLEKIYSSISSNKIPKGAKVYFTTETTNEKSKKQNMIATVHFSFYFNPTEKEKSTIDFKVNDYYTEIDKDSEYD